MRRTQALSDHLKKAINRQRLLDSARDLIAIPSPTGKAKAVLDRLAEMLQKDGFAVERPTGGYAAAPAVAARYKTGRAGKCLQFNGHLDTVHLPFIPPAVEGDRLTGSGAIDMKAGTIAAVEALRVLAETRALPSGEILMTAHDLHESPWGDGSQLNTMIQEGIVGDAVLIPEYLTDFVPVIGRGGLTWKFTIRRQGAPIHEVMRPLEEPSVIASGAQLIQRLQQLSEDLSKRKDALAGPETAFIGQIHSGEIYNQYPQECWLEGTRRWLPGHSRQDVETELRTLAGEVARATGTDIEVRFTLMRDAFRLDGAHPFVGVFQQAHELASGRALPLGAKPFCDDANSFYALSGIPAITHGPRGSGAHTLQEWVSIDDLVRVAHVYALTAVAYCSGES